MLQAKARDEQLESSTQTSVPLSDVAVEEQEGAVRVLSRSECTLQRLTLDRAQSLEPTWKEESTNCSLSVTHVPNMHALPPVHTQVNKRNCVCLDVNMSTCI